MSVSLILIIPVGQIDIGVLEYLRQNLQDSFGIAVQAEQPTVSPAYAFDKKRNQYHSAKILSQLPKSKRGNEKILGVVDADLYVPNLNFVFGEADVENGVCVISLARLRQEFYGQRPDKVLFFERALKEAVHELGHTYGLGHCQNPRCVMYFSNSLADTDYKGPVFCPKCRNKVK